MFPKYTSTFDTLSGHKRLFSHKMLSSHKKMSSHKQFSSHECYLATKSYKMFLMIQGKKVKIVKEVKRSNVSTISQFQVDIQVWGTVRWREQSTSTGLVAFHIFFIIFFFRWHFTMVDHCTSSQLWTLFCLSTEGGTCLQFDLLRKRCTTR